MKQRDLKGFGVIPQGMLKKIFKLVVDEGYVTVKDEKKKTFFLNFQKEGMAEKIMESKAYKQVCTANTANQSKDCVDFDDYFNRGVTLDDVVKEKGINAKNSHDETLLNLAASQNDLTRVKQLLTYDGIDVNSKARVKPGFTPLISAAANGNLEMVRLLIGAGADVNIHDEDGVSALSTAALHKNVEICRFLFRETKLDSYVISCLSSSLAAAVSTNSFEHVKFLLEECKVPADARLSSDGTSALIIALANGYMDIAEILVKHGADVNYKTDNGVNALHAAAKANCIKGVEYAINNGSKLDEQELKGGATALHFACALGHATIVELLLKAGADPDIREKYGSTPYDLTREFKQVKCKNILETANAKRKSSACQACKKEGFNFPVCSRCKKIQYCTAECQKAHWKIHKPDCKPEN